jgi:ribonuclease HI
MEPPDSNFVKVNTDRAFNPSSEEAAAGGLIRDSHGSFLIGFSSFLGAATITMAEMWAVREGLRLAVAHGFDQMQASSVSICALEKVGVRGGLVLRSREEAS